jgi:hypothetical protein
MINMQKRGQLTTFVIIGIILVSAVALVFLMSNNVSKTPTISATKDPQGFIQKCVKDSFAEAELKIIPHGGFLQVDASNSITFNGTKAIWMCYTSMNLMICTNRHPMLSAEMEKEIKTYIQPKIEDCFKTLGENLGRYEYKQENVMNITVLILPGQTMILLGRTIEFTKNKQTSKIDNFNVAINSPLYDFAAITNEAVNQEVQCQCGEETCNADIFKLNRNNPDFEIRRFVSGKNEKVYTIKEILTNKEFNFGVRNCVR